MSEVLRTYLYDAEGLPEEDFRAPFEQIRNVNIQGRASSWDELTQWLRLSRLDLVVVNLGGEKNQGLAIVQRIAETAPGISILGVSRKTDPQTIIAAMRAGCSQFVAWPIDPADLKEAVDRICTSRTQTLTSSKRVCVIGSAGGAGATSITCNLAVELGDLSGRRSAVVDMNLEFGDVSSSFDCNPPFTIADVCRGEGDIDRLLLEKAMHELPCSVSVLAAPKTIADAHAMSMERIGEMFRVMSELFPYVVVDLPRSYTLISYAVPQEADDILLVTQLGVPFIRNATRIFECLTSIGVAPHQIKIVLNRCNSAIDRITPKDVEEHFGQPVFAMVPNDYQHVKRALDFGQPLGEDAPKSPAKVAIQQLAHKIAGTEPENTQWAQKGKGLLSKLWRRSAKANI